MIEKAMRFGARPGNLIFGLVLGLTFVLVISVSMTLSTRAVAHHAFAAEFDANAPVNMTAPFVTAANGSVAVAVPIRTIGASIVLSSLSVSANPATATAPRLIDTPAESGASRTSEAVPVP